MRTLMITKFLPLPDDSGGRQRSLAIARRLAERGELVLCAYDDGAADHAGLRALGIDVRAVAVATGVVMLLPVGAWLVAGQAWRD